MPLEELFGALGGEIEDVEEGLHELHCVSSPQVHEAPETFLLFAQSFPHQDLGIVDPKASTIEITVGGQDMHIQQSPTLLKSNREGGTTGAGA